MLQSISSNSPFVSRGTPFGIAGGIPNQNIKSAYNDNNLQISAQKIEESLKFLKINNDIKNLKKSYILSDATEIDAFIFNNPFLIEILEEAPLEVKKRFGNNVKFLLEITIDPEENFSELFIIIKSRYDAQKARQLMDDLDNEWFLGKLKITRGKLCITEEPDEF